MSIWIPHVRDVKLCFCFSNIYSVWGSLVPSSLLQMTLFPSLWWLYSIPLYRIFFTHSSVGGHLGCFHILAIVNSAVVNIRVHVFFWIMVFFGYTSISGIAGSYCSSIFSFLRVSILFSIVSVSICTPSNSTWGFPFLHTLSSIYYL